MRRTNVRALLLATVLGGCSTASSPRPEAPNWTTAECPRAEVTIDRSFAASPPPCIAVLAATAAKPDGASNVDVQVNLGKEVAIRDVCLLEATEWIANERKARTINGAPNT